MPYIVRRPSETRHRGVSTTREVDRPGKARPRNAAELKRARARIHSRARSNKAADPAERAKRLREVLAKQEKIAEGTASELELLESQIKASDDAADKHAADLEAKAKAEGGGSKKAGKK